MRPGLLTLACIAFFLAAAYLYFVYAPKLEPSDPGATVQRGSVRVGDLDRTYLLYAPDDLGPSPPLLLALHGSMGDGAQMRMFTGYEFEALADQHGFIVAYPEGFEQHWNDCRKKGPYAAKQRNIDDTGFLRALIAHVQAEHGAGPVFLVGYSNGGHMAYRMALEHPGQITAVAAIAANLPAASNLDCTPSGKAVPVLILNGTKDPINPFEGGKVTIFGFGDRGDVLSSYETAAYFAGLGGNDAAPEMSLAAGAASGGQVEQFVWAAPGSGEVILYTLQGGGHTVPQQRYRFPRILGGTLADIDGPAEIWSFFDRQVRGPALSGRVEPVADDGP